MTQSSFTPGPWTLSATYPAGDFVIHAKGIPWQLAYVPASTQIEWPLEANARLIAAAPDLLAFAEEVKRRCVDAGLPGHELVALADAAIAKATS
jgi:hypothetical protein